MLKTSTGKECEEADGVRNWKRAAKNREEWKGLIREAKARCRSVAPQKKKKKPSLPYLMRPYPKRILDDPRRDFNYRFCRV
jgi:hypothetical protein